MNTSIGLATYDLLLYHGSGSFALFERCFKKALSYCSVSLPDTVTRQYRNFLYHHLRTTGYIDVVSDSSVDWAAAPPALVQTEPDQYVLIGGSVHEALLRAHLSSTAISTSSARESFHGIPQGTVLYPKLLSLQLQPDEVQRLGESTELSFSNQYQQTIFASLPTPKSVFKAVLEQTSADFEPDSAEILKPTDLQWAPYPHLAPTEPGLYRQQFAFSRKLSLYLVTPELDTFKIRDAEWAYFCFLVKNKLPLRISYDQQTKVLSWHRPFTQFRLPTLLERCLRSGKLQPPARQGRLYHYPNIQLKSLQILQSKYQFLEVVAR